ncbi:MAG: hypothetical protein ABIG98_05450, partial [Chloroflexota bacterium]
FTATYQKPWISLTYDGIMETNNLAKINDFAELVKFCSKETGERANHIASPNGFLLPSPPGPLSLGERGNLDSVQGDTP